MTCVVCTSWNPDGVRFCHKCGADYTGQNPLAIGPVPIERLLGLFGSITVPLKKRALLTVNNELRAVLPEGKHGLSGYGGGQTRVYVVDLTTREQVVATVNATTRDRARVGLTLMVYYAVRDDEDAVLDAALNGPARMGALAGIVQTSVREYLATVGREQFNRAGHDLLDGIQEVLGIRLARLPFAIEQLVESERQDDPNAARRDNQLEDDRVSVERARLLGMPPVALQNPELFGQMMRIQADTVIERVKAVGALAGNTSIIDDARRRGDWETIRRLVLSLTPEAQSVPWPQAALPDAKPPEAIAATSSAPPGIDSDLYEAIRAEMPYLGQPGAIVRGAVRLHGVGAKVAVTGAGRFIGTGGATATKVRQRLGEPLDFIEWDPDQRRFLMNAFRRLDPTRVLLDESTGRAQVVLPAASMGRARAMLAGANHQLLCDLIGLSAIELADGAVEPGG